MSRDKDNKEEKMTIPGLTVSLICDCKYLVVTDEAILVPTQFVIQLTLYHSLPQTHSQNFSSFQKTLPKIS